MRHIAEAARTTPVLHETEVLVVGGGPGGLAAAVAAARAGAQTTLVDRYGCFGGVITQVGVDTVAWYRREETVDLEGIGREFERRAEEFGGGTPDVQSQSLALDSELFKVVADRMVLEAGVEPLLHCLVTEPIVEGGLVRGVITESKSGRQAILAERVIDATGDADVAFRAGAPCHTRPRGTAMGVTVMFSCSERGQGALPRLRRRERAHLRRLGQVLGTSRPTARRTASSARTCRSRSTAPARTG